MEQSSKPCPYTLTTALACPHYLAVSPGDQPDSICRYAVLDEISENTHGILCHRNRRGEYETMKITISYFNGCPHWEVARDRVDEAIRLSQPGDVTVELELIETPEAAEKACFIGSPTVLIDGHDPFDDSGGGSFGLSCRRYRTEVGIEGSPSVKQLVELIA